jgi:ABC-2 type transport system ATP-binding protein
MKQLAKLAQAIVHGPRLIFLDEPTNGLDPPARARMIELIRQIRDSGKAHILLSSHLLRDVEECCEEILIIKSGRIAVYCNLEEERKSNRKFLELETRGERDAFADAVAKLGCEYALTSERRLNFKRDSLEDIFLKAMEDGNGVDAQAAGLPYAAQASLPGGGNK